MSLQFKVHDIDQNVIQSAGQLCHMLSVGETMKVTIYTGYDVQDFWLFYEDGKWTFELIEYDPDTLEEL